nr:intraflagellar transport protein 43 homolog isoform X1 [Leptinotarsa decemlineata]
MNWDEDIDLLTGKKSAPKQGRRSNQNMGVEENEDLTRSMDENTFEPVKVKKTSVWSEDPPKSSRSAAGSNMIELERFQNDRVELDDDIPIIPDIDDLQDDSLNLSDVKPIISVNKSTYKELDNQFENFQSEQISIGNLGDIDLSFLMNKLYPEKEVQPCTEIWTLDSLFTDLSKANS